MTAHNAFITRTASILPFDPVGNDEMEDILGRPGGIPSKARRLTLRSNGIKARHYVLDPATGRSRMTNAQMTAAAVRGLCGRGFELEYLESLACGTSMPDQTMPSHGVMVHGELGAGACEVVTTSANCLAGVAALKYAWMGVASGLLGNGIATGSEVSSPLMHARNFEAEIAHRVHELEQDPGIAFEKDFLRWMLSDGAGALLVEPRPRPGEPALEILWIDLFSYAHLLPACMYSGSVRAEDGGLVGWMHLDPDERAQRSVFAVKQDVKLLNANIIRYTLVEPMRAVMARRGFAAGDVDWFLPHMSSAFFQDGIHTALEEMGCPIALSKWFTNLTTCGNTGAASIFIMLDELMRSGRLKDGDLILCGVPESARFSSGLFLLRAVI